MSLAPEALSEREAGLGGPEHMLEQMQQYRRVRSAVQALPDIYREVIELFYFGHLSYSDVAQQLNKPLATVKKRLYTARWKLQEEMSPMDKTRSRPSNDDAFANRVKFFLALKSDDLLQVRQLLRRQPDLLEAQTEWGVASDGWYWPLGTTALHWAAGTGNLALAKLLLEQGAEVDVPDRGGATPLHRAAHMGQAEMVRWLLQQGADPNTAPNSSLAPLHVAVIQNRPVVVQWLLSYGADPQQPDDNDRSPRDWAALKGWPEVAEKLGVESDADEERARPAGGPLGDGGLWQGA